MKLNLDSLKTEIESYLNDNNFLLFRGFSRRLEEMPEVEWDARQYPDYRQYLKVAKQLEVRLIVFHHREFAAGLIDDAMDDLESRYGYDEDGSIARRLNELRDYEGFTCAIEMSFEHDGYALLLRDPRALVRRISRYSRRTGSGGRRGRSRKAKTTRATADTIRRTSGRRSA